MSSSMTVHEMAAARAVCRLHGSGADALDHVVATISEMLDSTQPWTLQDAAAKGHARLVERLLGVAYGPAPAKEVHDAAAFAKALSHAAMSGHLEVVKLLLKWHPSCKVASAMEDAATQGHLAVLVWLHENAERGSDRMTLDAMDSAAVNGHLDVLQWLHANRREGCTTRAMDGSARAGRLAIVQWIHANRHEGCTTQAMDGAAANGHVDVLEWLRRHRREGYSSLAPFAARKNGHAHVLQWLEAKRADAEKPLVAWHERRPPMCPRHPAPTVTTPPTPIAIRSI